MSMNSNSIKRKTRTSTTNNINSKPPRTKGPPEKTIACEGVYSNPRFMHAAASLVGCLVQIQVKNGSLYEGVFTTFSHQLDIVLEMVNKVDRKSVLASGVSSSAGSLLVSFNSEDSITDKVIFKLQDIVMISTMCVDFDYATREGFTDTAISKANGPITDKELEPWEAPNDDVDGIALEGEEEINGGWDVNEMFRTNAEKYNVKSTYDSSLQGYTIPLEPKNTEEYKKQEAKATKIACEIESSPSYKHRCALENGDEEERFSAVIRPSDNSNRYVSRKRSVPSGKVIRSSMAQMQHHNKPQHLSYTGHSHNSGNVSHSYNKISNSVPTSASSPPALSATSPSGNKSSVLQVHTSQSAHRPSSPRQPVMPQHSHGSRDLSDCADKDEQKEFQGVPSEKSNLVEDNSSSHHSGISESSTKSTEKRREERKGTSQRGRDEQIASFKKFSSDFKLSDDNKSQKDEKDDMQSSDGSGQGMVVPVKDKDKEKEEKDHTDSDTEKLSASMKKFTLNPNAKAFTPRALPVATPPASLPPPRMHTQSPVVAVPQHQLMAGMGQPIFTTMTPQYVMSATPVSMSLTPPFAPASVTAAPRYRKIPMTVQPRHEFSPSVHVAAATGQPICQVAPPLTVQYTPTQGMVHAPGPHQAAMAAYPQVMYPVVGPRVMSPQPMGLVPTSHAGSYGEAAHLPQLFMSPHPGATALAAPHAVQTMVVPQGAGGPHSNPATPQSQTPLNPSMHTAPSPVHQAPNTGHPTPSQTPTPTGHQGPQPVVYHGQMAQPPMQPGAHHSHTPPSTQTPHVNQAHPHYQHSNFTAGPQHLVFMHQQAVPSSHSHHPAALSTSGPHTLQGHHLHGQAAATHMGAHTHVISHTPMVIPTSATMVPAPAPLQNSPYVPHPQGV